jgi:hypothetical protein
MRVPPPVSLPRTTPTARTRHQRRAAKKARADRSDDSEALIDCRFDHVSERVDRTLARRPRAFRAARAKAQTMATATRPCATMAATTTTRRRMTNLHKRTKKAAAAAGDTRCTRAVSAAPAAARRIHRAAPQCRVVVAPRQRARRRRRSPTKNCQRHTRHRREDQRQVDSCRDSSATRTSSRLCLRLRLHGPPTRRDWWLHFCGQRLMLEMTKTRATRTETAAAAAIAAAS